jgi:hypothetical protein
MQPSDAAVNQSAGASPLQSESAGWPQRLTLVLLLVASAAVRLYCLACKPFWFDECFSVEVARIDWRNFLHLLWWREANMSLYYLLLRWWLHWGQSPFFIRSLSVVIATLTVPAIYWLALQLYDRRVAVVAAALFVFNGFGVRYSQEARSYSLFLLLATLSSGFLIAVLKDPKRRNWIGYVLASILAVYAHFYALLLIVAHWLALRRAGSSFMFQVSKGSASSDLKLELRDSAPRLRDAWAAIAAGVLPLLIFVAKTGAGPIRWIQRPGPHDVLSFYEHLAGGDIRLLLVYVVASGVAVAPCARRLLAHDQNWETWRCQFLLVWLVFPTALTVLLSFARPVFLGRYMIFCLPAFLVLVAAGIARLRQTWLLGIALIALLFLSGQGILFTYGHDFDEERDASSTATGFILDHSQPGDAIIFHIAETRIPYEFFRSLRAGENTASSNYTAHLGPEIVFPRHGAGLDYRDFTGKPTAELARSTAARHSRIWIMLMNNGPEDKPDPTTVMLTQVLPESLPKMTVWRFTKVEIRLYSRP